MISFVIPVYRTPESLLRNCLNSVLRYSLPMELVCVLDSPGEPCERILDDFVKHEPRMRLLKNECNRGVSFARNRGLAAAVGEWIAFVDADDEIIAEAYERAVEVATQKLVNACAVSAHVNPSEICGVRYGEYLVSNLRDKHHDSTIAEAYCWAVYPMVIRRDVWKRCVGGFVVGHRFGEDFMAVVKLLCSDGDYAFLNLRGYKCVGHEGSACRSAKTADNYIHGLKAALSVLRQVTRFGVGTGAMRWYLQHTIPTTLFDPEVSFYVRGKDRADYKETIRDVMRLCGGECSPNFKFLPLLLIRLIAKFPSLWFLPGVPCSYALRTASHFGMMLKT